MNRAVSNNQVKGIQVKIKTLQSSTVLLTQTADIKVLNGNNSSATFNIDNGFGAAAILKSKQYYKFQIAYIHQDNTVGNYSTVAIGKCTSQPSIEIENLSLGSINYHTFSYSGIYQNEDSTETVATYRFDLLNSNKETYFTTGDIVHRADNDSDIGCSINICNISQDLNDELYYLRYTVTTINGIVCQTPDYALKKSLNISMDIANPILSAIPNRENGYIALSLNANPPEQNIAGNFKIFRADETNNYLNWQECYSFSLNDSNLQRDEFWKDYTIEHEKKYKYSIVQFYETLQSERVKSNTERDADGEPVSISFDDIFLFDGERQISIKFNPKVASFKNNNIESKIETIGKQHPFIFRNSNISYKEFPISGLISRLMDVTDNTKMLRKESKLYKKISETPEVDDLSTNLISSNIYKEREYKLDILDWLTNGKPKLFRSPTEGNYIVRLMNVSLTPNDQLGRMLHTFNCTAYEIAECSYENMNLFGILGINETTQPSVMRWKTIPLNTAIFENNSSWSNNILPDGVVATTIRFYDMKPGQTVEILFKNNHLQRIVIGSTGMYRLEYNKYEIESIKLFANNLFGEFEGYLTYSYETLVNNNFKTYDSVEVISIPSQQYIGKTNIIDNILNIGTVRNSKISILSIPRIHFTRRPTVILREESEQTYYKYDIITYQEQEFNLSEEANEYSIYVIVKYGNEGILKLNDFKVYKNDNLESIVPENETLETFEKELFQITIGDNYFNVQDSYDFSYENENSIIFDKNKNLRLEINDGIIAEISYNLRSETYILELDPEYNILQKKQDYENSLLELEQLFEDGPTSDNSDDLQSWGEDIDDQKTAIKQKYINYIITLENELLRQKIVEGLIEEPEGGEAENAV